MSSRIKQDVQKLFEFWCELSYCSNGPESAATILKCFPDTFCDSKVINSVPDFAFPCEFENISVQSFSFVTTNDDSKFRFGFCRHDPKTQTSMVLVTYLPWHNTFLKLLSVLSEIRRNWASEFQSFLSEAYNKGIPESGSSLKLFYNSGQNHFTFQRPSQFELPSIPENHNLNLYYNFVDSKNMIAVFAAMLSERRIIFSSRRLDRLSACIQAASAFLFPMVWQHIFIPVLPMKMKDFLCAPMPYLIGVPEAVLGQITAEELGDVVILNCDNNEFRTPFDDVRQMPLELVLQMKKHLDNANELIGDRISKIFLRVLVQLIGGYRDAAKYSQGQRITWDRDTFIESRSPHLRNFLSRIMQLQLFQQFIDERLDILNSGQGISDEFEMETLRYMDKMRKRGKLYRDFLRNVKDKTSPVMKSTVKSVKNGSRGVKMAYKDIKSKLRDITPPKPLTADIHEADDTRRHFSAPNSPVVPRRDVNSDFSLEVPQKPYLSYTKSSYSPLMNGSSGFSNQNAIIKNNNLYINSENCGIITDPTISPSRSLSSSEMNITQELENHPLFKSAIINRSLKSSNSLEYSGFHAAPCVGPSLTTYLECGRSGASTGDTDPSRNAREIDRTFEIDEMRDFSSETAKICATSISLETKFDAAPNMLIPPLPPKRKIGERKDEILKKNFLNNFSPSVALNTTRIPIEQKSLAVVAAAHHSQSVASSLSLMHVLQNKLEEPTTLETEKMEDLISLDESNDNFDLSDLDPLNKSAKPIPDSLHQPSTSMNPICISNPSCPKFVPVYANENENTSESELLRQYGLDKFKLTTGGGMQKTYSKSTWTTFD